MRALMICVPEGPCRCINCGSEFAGWEYLFDHNGDPHCPECTSTEVSTPQTQPKIETDPFYNLAPGAVVVGIRGKVDGRIGVVIAEAEPERGPIARFLYISGSDWDVEVEENIVLTHGDVEIKA